MRSRLHRCRGGLQVLLEPAPRWFVLGGGRRLLPRGEEPSDASGMNLPGPDHHGASRARIESDHAVDVRHVHGGHGPQPTRPVVLSRLDHHVGAPPSRGHPRGEPRPHPDRPGGHGPARATWAGRRAATGGTTPGPAAPARTSGAAAGRGGTYGPRRRARPGSGLRPGPAATRPCPPRLPDHRHPPTGCIGPRRPARRSERTIRPRCSGPLARTTAAGSGRRRPRRALGPVRRREPSR